jgi:hypothetical protein
MSDDIVKETTAQVIMSNPLCIADQEGGGKNSEQVREIVCWIHRSHVAALVVNRRPASCLLASLFNDAL